MFELVNAERTGLGIPALTWDTRLVPIARAHAQEMFELDYFDHVSPVTGSPFDRLAAAGIAYSWSGENLAMNQGYPREQSTAVAHEGLMNSPGHRENILRPEFTRMGIGVIDAGSRGRMYVQLFLTPP